MEPITRFLSRNVDASGIWRIIIFYFNKEENSGGESLQCMIILFHLYMNSPVYHGISEIFSSLSPSLSFFFCELKKPVLRSYIYAICIECT